MALATLARRVDMAKVLFVLVFLAVAGGQAQAADLFTVKYVNVDVEGENTLVAKDEALIEGQHKALAELLRRITPESYWEKLPTFDDVTTQKFVRAFQVQSEKTTPTRYIATLSVRFDPGAIRGVLKNRGIPYKTTAAKRAVLVPVLGAGAGAQLWDDANGWRRAWSRLDLSDTLTPYTLPLGDLADMTTLTADQALAPDTIALRAFAQRHGTEDLVVAQALPAGSAVNIRMVRYIGIGGSLPNPDIYEDDGSLDSPDETEEVDAQAIVRERIAMLPPPEVITAEITPPAGQDPMLAAAAGALSASESWWKGYSPKGMRTPAPKTYALRVEVPFNGYGGWLTVQRKLGDDRYVKSTNLRAISTRGAIVTIYYQRKLETVIRSLRKQDLDLTKSRGRWMLVRYEPYTPPPAPEPKPDTEGAEGTGETPTSESAPAAPQAPATTPPAPTVPIRSTEPQSEPI